MKPTDFNVDEIERMPNMAKLEKPKQKQGETDEAFAKRLADHKTAVHQEMLKKQSAQRMPRVAQAILSVGALSTHNPTTKQVEAIMTVLDKAVATVRERLQGKAAQKPSFVLPD